MNINEEVKFDDSANFDPAPPQFPMTRWRLDLFASIFSFAVYRSLQLQVQR